MRSLMMRTPSLIALVLAVDVVSAAPPPSPNVIMVITDDQGYGDLGYYGNPIVKTPHLDRFASESVRMTQFYVSPVCSPTRSSLMTGLYNYRTGVVDTFLGRSMMRPGIATLAETLAASGYRTGLFGKWHLGDCYPLRPEDRGFQETLWHHGGGLAQPSDAPELDQATAYFDPILTRNGKEVRLKGYCTDVFTDAAIQFIQADAKKPFFAYIAYNAPHAPYQVPDEDAAPYRKADLKVEDFPKVGQPWATGKFNSRETANAYGMIANLDTNFGKLLKLLDDKKLRDSTLVIFLTDNGPGGVRFNSGFRNRKGTVYEGGIRVPGFFRCPDQFKGDRNIHTPAAHIDLMPTILDACGVRPQAEIRFDGVSLWPLLQGRKTDLPERLLFTQWHRGDVPEKFRAFAARGPQYKLVQAAGASANAKWQPKYELFDLKADPYEQKDLAEMLPEEVAKLKKAYEIWFDDVTKAGFEPPRIVLGSEKQEFVRLTRQDWRGDKAGWAADSIGHWEVEFERAGRYEIKLRARQPFNRWSLRKGMQLQGGGGPDKIREFTVVEQFRAGAKTRLTATVDAPERGVDYLEIKYLGQ